MIIASIGRVLSSLYVFLFFFSYLLAEDQLIEKTLIQLVEQSPGTLIDFSPNIRAQAISNPVQQSLHLSLPDLLLEQTCSIDGKGSFTKQTSVNLADCTFTKHPELSTLTITENQSSTNQACTIKFASITSLNEAAALLTQLQEQVEKSSKKVKAPSQIAREYGYTYLAVSPRGHNLNEMLANLSQLTGKNKSSLKNGWCWLTRTSNGDTATLLEEAGNRLPIFLFPLENIDSANFYVTNQINGEENHYSHSKGHILQSARSKNSRALQEFLGASKNCTIVFQTSPKLSKSTQAFLLPNSMRRVPKVPSDLSSKFLSSVISKTEPLFNLQRPSGTTLLSTAGTSPYSDNALLYAIRTYSFKDFTQFLKAEYPTLVELLQQPSKIYPSKTMWQLAFSLDSHPITACTTQEEIYNRISLLGFELGSPFGPESQLKTNSYPLFLSLLEQTALHKTYGPIIEWFYFNPIPENRVQLLFHIDRLAYETFLPREQVWRALYHLQTLFKLEAQSLEDVRPLVPTTELFLSGKPSTILHEPQRLLYSSYFWERNDPLHRDGLALMIKRNKYEAELLQKPHSKWYGRFFKWLEQQNFDKPATIYLSKDERKAYLAQFDGNKIIHPKIKLSPTSKSVMFVVDSEGSIYIGVKSDGGVNIPAFAHSSFLAGEAVTSAGRLVIGSDGTILEMNDFTGHYRSGQDEIKIAARAFTGQGVDMSQVKH